MKIASYHKQKGDAVIFVTTPLQLEMKSDLTYIAKEDENLSVPVKFMRDEKVRKMGDGFKVLKNYIPPPVILSCRPDYMLYPRKEKSDKFDNADILQFFDYKGKKLPIIQPFANTLTNKKTLVIDKKFWISSKEDLLEALIALKQFQNLAFLEPISIRRMVDDKDIKEAFLALHFGPDSRIVWRNTIREFDKELEALEFLSEFNEKNPTFIGDVEFNLFTKVHTSIEEAKEDLNRVLILMNEFKKKKIAAKFKEQDISTFTALNRTFTELLRWNLNGLKVSLLEFACAVDCEIRNCTIEDFYSNSKW